MTKKQKFSAKVCFWCSMGIILCLITAFIQKACELPQIEKEGIITPNEPNNTVGEGSDRFSERCKGKGNASQPTLDDLLDAICWVESKGDANAVGDKVILTQFTKVTFLDYLENEYDKQKASWVGYEATNMDTVSVYEYRAIGAYQLHKIYVDDCNRILRLMGGTGHYTYADRWDRDKSRFMTKIVTTHYAMKDWKSKRWDMMGCLETAARTHKNPTLRNHESTKAYWLKVKEALAWGVREFEVVR